MCLIIASQTGQIPSDSLIESSFENNPHGWGIVRLRNGVPTVFKGMSKEEYIKEVKKCQGLPYIAHTRWATHGSRDITNCHPFKLWEDTYLAHNGIINQVSIRKKNRSDTWHYTEMLTHALKKIQKEQGDDAVQETLRSPEFVKKIEEFVGGGNKIVMMLNDGTIVIANEAKGTKEGEIWYSNTNSHPTNVRTVRNATSYYYSSTATSLLNERERIELWEEITDLEEEVAANSDTYGECLVRFAKDAEAIRAVRTMLDQSIDVLVKKYSTAYGNAATAANRISRHHDGYYGSYDKTQKNAVLWDIKDRLLAKAEKERKDKEAEEERRKSYTTTHYTTQSYGRNVESPTKEFVIPESQVLALSLKASEVLGTVPLSTEDALEKFYMLSTQVAKDFFKAEIKKQATELNLDLTKSDDQEIVAMSIIYAVARREEMNKDMKNGYLTVQMMEAITKTLKANTVLWTETLGKGTKEETNEGSSQKTEVLVQGETDIVEAMVRLSFELNLSESAARILLVEVGAIYDLYPRDCRNDLVATVHTIHEAMNALKVSELQPTITRIIESIKQNKDKFDHTKLCVPYDHFIACIMKLKTKYNQSEVATRELMMFAAKLYSMAPQTKRGDAAEIMDIIEQAEDNLFAQRIEVNYQNLEQQIDRDWSKAPNERRNVTGTEEQELEKAYAQLLTAGMA